MELYKNKFLRSVVLPILRKFGDRKIRITHPYTKDKFQLNLYKHKGYWYHGKNREGETTKSFYKLIKKTDTIIEIGGHIGFFSTLYGLLAKEGEVIVFEPGSNNLPYLLKNIESYKNVKVEEIAISAQTGKIKFYEEELTGQNNSILKDFFVFERNKEVSFSSASFNEKEVKTTTLDNYLAKENKKPHFIKIDIEGAEFEALKGMTKTLSDIQPILMVEINHLSKEIFSYLKAHNYDFFDSALNKIKELESHTGNTFCIHNTKISQYEFLS